MCRPEGEHTSLIFCLEDPACGEKNGPKQILGFTKMGVQKKLITMKKGLIGSKIKEKRIQNALKLYQMAFISDFSELLYHLGSIISGTICDRDKPIFSAESGSQWDRHKIGTQLDRTSKKQGSSL